MKKRSFYFVLVLLLAVTMLFACDSDGEKKTEAKAESYTLSYTVSGEDEIFRVIAENNQLKNFEVPKKAGHAFVGLYNAAEGGSKVIDAKGKVQGVVIDRDMTLYARFEALTYRVAFKNGDEVLSSFLYTYGDTISEPDRLPTKEGMLFSAWRVGERLYGGADGLLPQELILNEKNYAFDQSEIIFEAEYAPRKIKIQLMDNMGGLPVTKEFAYGEDITLDALDDTENAQFVCWSYSQTVKAPFGTAKANDETDGLILYGYWEEYKTVSFHFGSEEIFGENAVLEYRIYKNEDFTLPVSAVTREHYTLEGFYTDSQLSSNSKVYDISYHTAKSDYYAAWMPVNYTASFKTNGGEDVASVTFNIESKDIELPTSTRMHYQHEGWFTTSDLSGASQTVIPAGSTGDKVYYAAWTPLQYTVQFETNGGAEIPSVTYTVELDQPVLLPVSQKQHYAHAGWYDNEALEGEPIKAIVPGMSGNIVLYAAWMPSDYTVSFEENGGEKVEDLAYTVEAGISALPKTITKNHYTFAGWFNNEKFEGEEVTEIATGTTGNLTLFAKWLPKEYTVSFVTNGGEALEPMTYTVESEAFALPQTGKVHYTFASWHTKEDLSDKAVTSVLSGTAGDLVFYAKYVPEQYTVTFHGAICEELTYTVESEELALHTPSKEFWTFCGWCRESDLSDEPILSLPAGSYGDVDLYARFERSASLNCAPGTLGEGVDGQATLVYGQAYTLPIPGRTGYRFTGYFDKAGESGVQLTDARGNSLHAWTEDGDIEEITFVAHFELMTYQIVYDSMGGAELPDDHYTMNDGFKPLPSLQRDYFEFLGWRYADNYDGEAVESIPVGTTGDVYLIAKWKEIDYEISFISSSDGTSVHDKITYTYGSNKALPVLEDTENLHFVGWCLNEDLSDVPTTALSPDMHGNLVLYPKFAGVIRTVVYDANGGEIQKENAKIEYGTKYTLEVPTRHAYRFEGWFSEDGQIQYTDENGKSKGTCLFEATTTVVAKWTAINYRATFSSAYGGLLAPVFFTVESTAIALPTYSTADCEKWGVVFGGWFADEACSGSAVTSIDPGSSGDCTYFAKWTPITYTVRFESNGGSTVDIYQYTVESANYAFPTPSKRGYRFEGWFDNAELSGSSVSGIGKGEIGDRKLYAKWSLEYYDIILNLNGGTLSSTPPENYTFLSPTVTLPEPTRNGYTFAGYYTSSSFVGTPVKTISAGSIGKQVFHAKWTANTYTITFVTGGTPIAQMTYTPEKAVTLPTTTTSTGRKFAGWYTNSSLSGSSVSSVPKGSYGNKTFYARFSTDVYTITYYLNGGSFGSGSYVTVYTVDDSVTLSKPTRSAYDFAGWYTNSSCTGNPVTNISKGSTGNKSYYAKWVPKTYTISFNMNGGPAVSSKTYTVETATFTLPTPAARSGYNFEGYYTNASFTGSPITQISRGSTGNMTVYAKWSYKSVTYDSGEVKKTIDASYEYPLDHIDLSSLEVFMNSGYTFHFKVRVKMAEKHPGYQEIYICKSDQTRVGGIGKEYDATWKGYEYGGSGDPSTTADWVTFDDSSAKGAWSVSGANCTKEMIISYGANGGSSLKYPGDDWYRYQTEVTVTVTKN